MGKVAALGRYAEKDNKFACVIRFRMGVEKVDWKKLIKKVGVSQTTHFKRLKEPESMTVRELREYINALKISKEDVIDALYLDGRG